MSGRLVASPVPAEMLFAQGPEVRLVDPEPAAWLKETKHLLQRRDRFRQMLQHIAHGDVGERGLGEPRIRDFGQTDVEALGPGSLLDDLRIEIDPDRIIIPASGRDGSEIAPANPDIEDAESALGCARNVARPILERAAPTSGGLADLELDPVHSGADRPRRRLVRVISCICALHARRRGARIEISVGVAVLAAPHPPGARRGRPSRSPEGHRHGLRRSSDPQQGQAR